MKRKKSLFIVAALVTTLISGAASAVYTPIVKQPPKPRCVPPKQDQCPMEPTPCCRLLPP